ncbi:endoglucanase [Actinoplanes sp. SE50]|uniref:glycosyl hydrolase n=1 Tax=unclassified Actinoplanes TaxID=2626549 RepID=UPI00023EBE7B|nr:MULTISPECIES: glycosyl hydrolase [unclassified Actinoplanes]AEV81805.1 Endoglucanase H [Actinoplanes sp. SE50/110]ATO80206.1 endoglucanase [Actinoplanes sp. SE50]SLL97610.1 endoglucanase [Actinoplanes sp. SE50/110]
MRRAGLGGVLVGVLLILSACSGSHRGNPAPPPSPDLTARPPAIAVQDGPFAAGPFTPPATGAYVGAWIKPDQLTHIGRLEAVDTLEASLGRRLDILNTYRRFDQMVGTESDQEFLAQGQSLMISWATGDNRSILDGEHDRLIRQQAEAIRRIGRPVLLRMRWEMDRPNLRATMWSGADYIAAWKYVRAIFQREHADNVSWVWCPTAEGFQRGDAQQFYPGDDQVDWTCVDVYAGADFQPIGQLMGPFLQWAAQRPKPIIIGEFGVAKAWGSANRAAWLRDAERTFKANRQIKAVAYFESDPTGNGPNQQFQLSGDKAAFKAFHALAKDPYFNVGR